MKRSETWSTQLRTNHTWVVSPNMSASRCGAVSPARWSKQLRSIKAQLKTWKTQIQSQQSLRPYRCFFVYWWYLLTECRWFELSLYPWWEAFEALEQEGGAGGRWKWQTHLVNCDAAPPSAALIRKVAAEPRLQGRKYFLFAFFLIHNGSQSRALAAAQQHHHAKEGAGERLAY